MEKVIVRKRDMKTNAWKRIDILTLQTNKILGIFCYSNHPHT